jgi:hypothetical protein
MNANLQNYGEWIMTLVVIAILCSSCYVGVIQPTPTPTKPVLPTLTATDTPNPTPTPETWCEPGSYAVVAEPQQLWEDAALTVPAFVGSVNEWHTVYLRPAKLAAGEAVLLLFDRTESAWLVIAAEGTRRVGWLALEALPVGCR